MTINQIGLGIGVRVTRAHWIRQWIMTRFHLFQRWKDDYLTWNPDDYGGVWSVKMSHEKIWVPDVMLYNT